MRLLPAPVDVVWRLPCQNQLELVLELAHGNESCVSALLAAARALLLACDPIADVGIGELLQQALVELVVVDQSREAVAAAIPDMPDEGAVVEQPAMLLEEAVAQP